jgi:hypothetical protein
MQFTGWNLMVIMCSMHNTACMHKGTITTRPTVLLFPILWPSEVKTGPEWEVGSGEQ